MNSAEVVEHHQAAGREFAAAGVRSFVREQGDGQAVVCIHGVPASCFLYRKVLDELATRGLRGVAFDLPGLGLAERPDSFDYTWTGLGRFCAAAVDALSLERFHLVVHDIGGPIGFELAAAMRERVDSLTVLNTMIEVDRFKRPWMMEPYARRGVNRVHLATTTKWSWWQMWRYAGVANTAATPRAEVDAYIDLLKRADGGRAFLKIMRGFERTAAKRRLYEGTVRDVPYPVQVVWGELDPALALDEHAEHVRLAAGLDRVHTVVAKHFLQEDQAPAVAGHVAALAGTPRG